MSIEESNPANRSDETDADPKPTDDASMADEQADDVAASSDTAPDTDAVSSSDIVAGSDEIADTEAVASFDAAPDTDEVADSDPDPVSGSDEVADTEAVASSDAAEVSEAAEESDAVAGSDTTQDSDAISSSDEVADTEVVASSDAAPVSEAAEDSDAVSSSESETTDEPADIDEDDATLLEPATRALADDAGTVQNGDKPALTEHTASVAQKDDTGDADGISEEIEDKPAPDRESVPLRWDYRQGAHDAAVELKRIEQEVRRLLDNCDTKRKRKLGGTYRWKELEDDLIGWRFGGRINDDTIAQLQGLIAQRNYYFQQLRFLSATRTTWNS